MLCLLRARLLAAAIVSAVPAFIAGPAHAQVSVQIGFDSFHDQLAPYGAWVYSDRWGTVWQPGDVPDDFRPYDTGGHWENTDEYGWTWVSDYEWGDVAFHYGRWVYDPDDGWLWMPGYVWSPAWVVWRGNNEYLGWMPMPPDGDFLSGRGDVGVSVSWSDPDRYYSDWYGAGFAGAGSWWVFVNYGHIADRDYHRHEARPEQVHFLVQQTRNVTNYTVVNNYIVNRSVDAHRVAQFAGHPIQPVAARTVIKHPNMVATVSRGEQVRAQMIHVAPRGNGRPNSAPPPPAAIVGKLSDRTVQHGPDRGHTSHLFTKSALSQPGAMNRFHSGGGNAPGGPALANAPSPNQPKPQDHAVQHNENVGAGNRHENGTAPEMQSGPQMHPHEGNANTRIRGQHEDGAHPPSAPSNPGPEPMPNRMPNDERHLDNGGARQHARPQHDHNVSPPEQAAPLNRSDTRAPHSGPNSATGNNRAAPMEGHPADHPMPGLVRGGSEHAPPPNADQGESPRNGHEKRNKKPEEPPPH